MAQITISINGYGYTVGCGEGQEAHLQEMAKLVEAHIDLIRQIGGQSGEGKLLALASLLMADKLHDLEAYVQSLEKKVDEQKLKQLRKENNQLKKRLETLADRAEAIAEKLNIA
ncbi:cell division protein ZapA [Commensalibacter oyaizuii]|uniref:Cell division protein ZapA n=1 Tax=Commensalibacter oyaizuii TaxID=3043873 RepID=A0ABT6PYG6_9PROT|nr:cell division protein ZapA [Commensalibacter sp. TBRC 16381]MDI2089902.1 cell division protein ZapA [Commensalibacter sp. TBRC 16381]